MILCLSNPSTMLILFVILTTIRPLYSPVAMLSKPLFNPVGGKLLSSSFVDISYQLIFTSLIYLSFSYTELEFVNLHHYQTWGLSFQRLNPLGCVAWCHFESLNLFLFQRCNFFYSFSFLTQGLPDSIYLYAKSTAYIVIQPLFFIQCEFILLIVHPTQGPRITQCRGLLNKTGV